YATPRRTVRAWMASPSHRKLLLAPTYREVGIGASRGNDKGGWSGALYTADLASRRLRR
ncbi:MAG: CAP domain-containing protein, partial [Solirubrobacteraceae bacterium]